jgi:hypothetical protein
MSINPIMKSENLSNNHNPKNMTVLKKEHVRVWTACIWIRTDIRDQIL